MKQPETWYSLDPVNKSTVLRAAEVTILWCSAGSDHLSVLYPALGALPTYAFRRDIDKLIFLAQEPK